MPVFFLATLLLGLVLSVLAMIYGVQRGSVPSFPTPPEIEQPRARLNWPAIAAFATLFGVVGYPLSRYSTLGLTTQVVVATAAGLLAAVGAVLLVAKWAIPSAMKDEVDERFVYMGHIARVTQPITATTGAIEYTVDGMTHALDARSLDGASVPADTEVVIERVEHGTAWVESWATVEKRI